ncbi:EI24 domain-containing protein [uncultured Ilyobacter sp.]|uniref:EI24 domain-containing protein n=1 Tax=uncultured Ilyobacter sp. TaxID=544433 RepID=UPI0029C6A63D|nr:EI24 domain-containing protein [uncultured Ilyobacter sp.]
MHGIYLAGESFFEAFSVIKNGKMKKFYLLPGILNLIIINFLYKLSKFISFNLFSKLERYFNLNSYENITFMIIKFIIIIIAFLLYFLIYKTLLLIVLSPFLNYISERTERTQVNHEFNFSFKDNMRFIWRGIVISCKSFSKEILGTAVLLLLGMMPFLSLTVPFFIFLLQAYYIGFSFMDYTLERHNYSSKESLIFLKKNWAFSTFSGAIFTMVFLIPVIGIFIAPLVSCVAVTVGTLKIIDQDKGNSTYK